MGTPATYVLPARTVNSARARLSPVVFTLTLLITLAIGATAAANPVGAGHVIRFDQEITNVGQRGVRVVMHKPAGDNGWSVHLLDRSSNEELAMTRVSEWVGAPYFDYGIESVRMDGADVILFSARPSSRRNAPPTADTLQLAYAYGEAGARAATMQWKEVARAEYSALDGGSSLEIRGEDSSTSLVLITTGESTICGGEFGLQAFVPSQMAFRTEISLDEATEGAQPLKSSLPDGKFERPILSNFYLWFSASSNRRNKDDSLTIIRPIELGDFDPSTAWTEGGSSDGSGQWVTTRINPALKTRGFRIFPGHMENETEFFRHRRPKRILIATDDGTRFSVEIPDVPYRTLESRGGLLVEFPEPLRTTCMTLILLDSRPARRNDAEAPWKSSSVAIGEVTPMSELHGLAQDVAALVTVEMLLKEGDPAKARRLALLSSPMGTELVRVLQRVVEGGSEEDRTRVAPLLRYLPSEEAVPTLMALFESIDSDDDSYMSVKRAMVTHREGAAKDLIAMLRNSPPTDDRKHVDLIRLVGRLGEPEDIRPLIRNLGQGKPKVRRERVRAIARGGPTMLDELFGIARNDVNSDAGYDALQAIQTLGRKLHFDAPALDDTEDALVVSYERADSARTRMMVLEGLKHFGHAGAAELLANVATRGVDPLVRKHAVEIVGRYPGNVARSALVRGLQDGSPDVRIEAARALEKRTAGDSSLSALKTYVARETWPQGLKSGYRAVASIGTAHSDQFMEESLVNNLGDPRAELIAGAMRHVDRPISPNVAKRALNSNERTYLLVRYVLDTLGTEDSEEGEQLLHELVQKRSWSGFDERRSALLRQRAILALGRRRTPEARNALLNMLYTQEDDAVQKAALRALAFFIDESLIAELEVRKRSAPRRLENSFDSAIDMIEQRTQVADIQDTIDSVDERLEERKKEARESE